MEIMETFEPKDGDHKGEPVVVVEILDNGIHKGFTLEGDFHYYNNDKCEVKRDGQEDMEGEVVSCEGCPFKIGANKCQLPIGANKPSMKSPRDHYRAYFKRNCERRY